MHSRPSLPPLLLAGAVMASATCIAGDNSPAELARMQQVLQATDYLVVSALSDPPNPDWCRREHCLRYRRVLSQRVLDPVERKQFAAQLFAWAGSDPPELSFGFGPPVFQIYVKAGKDVLVLEVIGDRAGLALTALLNHDLTPLAGFDAPGAAYDVLQRWSEPLPE